MYLQVLNISTIASIYGTFLSARLAFLITNIWNQIIVIGTCPVHPLNVSSTFPLVTLLNILWEGMALVENKSTQSLLFYRESLMRAKALIMSLTTDHLSLLEFLGHSK